MKLSPHAQDWTRCIANDELSRIGQVRIPPGAERSRDRYEIGFVTPGIFNDFFTHAAVQPVKLSTRSAGFRKKSLERSLAAIGGLFIAFVEHTQRFQGGLSPLGDRCSDGQDVL